MKFLIVILIFNISLILLNNCKSAEPQSKNTKISTEFMELTGSYENLSDNSVKFKLSAKRLKIREDEYMPDSEDFRVVVYNSEKELVFNSDYEQNFLMAISDVKPKNTGETENFEYIWNCRNNFKKKLPAGKYSAALIIPAKPEFYSINIDFEL